MTGCCTPAVLQSKQRFLLTLYGMYRYPAVSAETQVMDSSRRFHEWDTIVQSSGMIHDSDELNRPPSQSGQGIRRA